MIKMTNLLHKNFGKDTVVDKIFSGKLQYANLTEVQSADLYDECWSLLREWKIDIKDVYDSKENKSIGSTFYSFRDKNKKLHYTRISADDIVKIGPAANDNVINGIVVTKKLKRNNDPKLLNTHIANLVKYVNGYHPKNLFFSIEENDGYSEMRKRLFVGLASKFPELVKDVQVYGNNVTLRLK